MAVNWDGAVIRALLSKVATSGVFFPATTRIQAPVYLEKIGFNQPEQANDDDENTESTRSFHFFRQLFEVSKVSLAKPVLSIWAQSRPKFPNEKGPLFSEPLSISYS